MKKKKTLKLKAKYFHRCLYKFYFFDKKRYWWCFNFYDNGYKANQITSVLKPGNDNAQFHGVTVDFEYFSYEEC